MYWPDCNAHHESSWRPHWAIRISEVFASILSAHDEDEEDEEEAAEEGISVTSSDTSASCMYETAVDALDSEMVKGEEDRYWYCWCSSAEL